MPKRQRLRAFGQDIFHIARHEGYQHTPGLKAQSAELSKRCESRIWTLLGRRQLILVGKGIPAHTLGNMQVYPWL